MGRVVVGLGNLGREVVLNSLTSEHSEFSTSVRKELLATKRNYLETETTWIRACGVALYFRSLLFKFRFDNTGIQYDGGYVN